MFGCITYNSAKQCSAMFSCNICSHPFDFNVQYRHVYTNGKYQSNFVIELCLTWNLSSVFSSFNTMLFDFVLPESGIHSSQFTVHRLNILKLSITAFRSDCIWIPERLKIDVWNETEKKLKMRKQSYLERKKEKKRYFNGC